MRRLRLRAGQRDRRDAGFSLTELMVSMFITSLVIVTTVALTITFQRTNAQNFSRQEQIDTARSAVEAMSKAVRTAVKPAQLSCSTCTVDPEAFLEASGVSMRFYANLNNPGNSVGPSRVTYTLLTTGPDAGNLVEKIQVPDSNVPTGAGYQYCDAEAVGASAVCKGRLTVRPVAFGVVNDAASPIFRYYDQGGALMTPASGTSLSAAQLENILAVELLVTVQADNAVKAPPTSYIQYIMLPNAQAVIRLEEATP